MYLNDRQEPSCPSGTQCSSALSSTSTSSSLIPSFTPSPPPAIHHAVTISTISAAPSETTTVVVDTPSPTPKGPIIAGVICGVVVLAIFTAMLWCFCRRRKQLIDMARSTPLVGSDGPNGNKKFAMDQSVHEDAQRHSGGVFAPFGGYHKTPLMEGSDSSDHSENRSLDIATVPQTDADEDAPLPADPEKGTLVAPPAHEHPAYHPLPGQTPNVPHYIQSQHSAHPASRSVSIRDPAYDSLPSQLPKRSRTPPGAAYASIRSHLPPELTYDPRPQLPRVSSRAELPSANFNPISINVPGESPELPALTFSPISLDTDTHNTPGTTYQFPSPSEMAPIPIFSSSTDFASSMTARIPSPSQAARSIEEFRPTPLTASELVEIRTSISPFRPTPLSNCSVAELAASTSPFRPTPFFEAGTSEHLFGCPPQPSEAQSERTDYPFETQPLGTPSNEQPGFTPFRTPSLSCVARQLTHRHPSVKRNIAGFPLVPNLPSLSDPNTLPSPTPPPLKSTKQTSSRPQLHAVKTTYIPPRKPTKAKDLPFNYISLPSPQSPSSPSAVQSPSSGMNAVARNCSATTTYSIPIGIRRSHKRKDTANSAETVIIADPEVLLTHNHSREWSESSREHVMSWATYGSENTLMEGEEVFSPIMAQTALVQKVERVQMQAGRLLKRKPPTTELRSEAQRSQEVPKEGKWIPTKLEFKHTSRMSLRGHRSSMSPKQDKKTDSPESEKKESTREDVSPLFSPIMAGYKFSPLSPEEREWAGQQ